MDFDTNNEEDYISIQLHMKDVYLLYKSVKVHLEKWPGGDYEEQIYLQQMKDFLYKSVLEYKFRN